MSKIESVPRGLLEYKNKGKYLGAKKKIIFLDSLIPIYDNLKIILYELLIYIILITNNPNTIEYFKY